MNSAVRTLSLIRRAAQNYVTNRPFCVSFEITHSCNANCEHCHRGGKVDEKRATPEQFAARFQELKPLSVQISGGEPLLRRDVYDIIEALRQPDGTPYMIFVTNGWLLNAEKFDRLRSIGIDAFSVSFDYPDERHDEFRRIPGLFEHLKDLVEELGPKKARAITFNAVVQGKNFRELPKMAEVARDWGVQINFSPYTWMRTHEMEYLVQPEEIDEFRRITGELVDFKRRYDTIRTTDSFFEDMALFFENRSMPNCRAGERFLVVNPDATLSPCGLIITDYTSWDDLKSKFSAQNSCSYCHTCIRSNTEKPLNNLVRGGVKSLFS